MMCPNIISPLISVSIIPLIFSIVVVVVVGEYSKQCFHNSVDSSDTNDHQSESELYIFKSNSLPVDRRFMPVLSNGHVGFQVFGDSVYMNGLYNGEYGLSHRARIPNYANIQLFDNHNQFSAVEYSLNTKTGIFRIFYLAPNEDWCVEQLIYAHRFHNRAIINEIMIFRLNYNTSDTINVRLHQHPGNTTDDIILTNHHHDQLNKKFMRKKRNTMQQNQRNEAKNLLEAVTVLCGYTIQVEDPSYQEKRKHVCVLWNHVPEEITLKKDKKVMSFKFVMTVDGDLNVAEQEMMDVLAQSNLQLQQSHKTEWLNFWQNFEIKIKGDVELAKTIYGSVFYLTSALPSVRTNLITELFYGLSPTGLGIGGNDLNDYEGHNFWDTEIWMLPAILLINPKWTEELLHYRLMKLSAAQDFANQTGYSGARFPWESAFTGRDVTQPCCPLVASNQQHVTADIGHAVRSHLKATHDLDWLNREGCPLIEEIAKFWQSRIVKNDSTGFYDIRDIMGPDEDHEKVDNNVYTNVVVGLALYFAGFATCLCNRSDGHDEWGNMAGHIKLLYDSSLNYHPQYEEYTMGTEIKQADAVLIGYPLQYNMDKETRQNDLFAYEKVTRASGPAMTWAMHTISHLELKEYQQADFDFVKSYKNYARNPFKVWSEVIEGQEGAVNFITGAGGFLQAILYGYGGIRLYLDRMEINEATVPANSERLIINGINYLSSKFELNISENKTTLKCSYYNSNVPLNIIMDDSSQEICEQYIYLITNKQVTIRRVNNQFGICQLPRDIIGVPDL